MNSMDLLESLTETVERLILSFLTVKAENVAKEGSGNFISTSGIYSVNMKGVEIASTTNGATQANYITDKVMSYGNTVIDKSGNPIFGMDILEAFAAVLGEEGFSDPEATDIKFKTSTKELMCLPETVDVDVKVWVQFEYQTYKGEIKERVNVKRFYRDSDNASGSEVLVLTKAIKKANSGTPSDEKALVAARAAIGSQYAKDLDYSGEVKYEAGLDAEQVAAWKRAQANGGKAASAASTPAANSAIAAFPGAK